MERVSRIYLEGGGNHNKALQTELRAAFRTFFEKAGVKALPRLVACGGRQQTYERFRQACKNEEGLIILLVDSEGPVAEEGPWEYLGRREKWERPPGAIEEQAQLLVQQMESWFLADIQTLERYFGEGFRSTQCPEPTDVEVIPRSDVMTKLCRASRGSRRGEYHKGKHQCDILERLEPNRVRRASRHCVRLIDLLLT